jgi:hypothetical protein
MQVGLRLSAGRPDNHFIRQKIRISHAKAPPFLYAGVVKSYGFDTRRTPAASVHFPDFPLCVMPEKVKENDFPFFLRQS